MTIRYLPPVVWLSLFFTLTNLHGQRPYRFLPYTSGVADSLSEELTRLSTQDPEYVNTALLLATRLYRIDREEQAEPLARQALEIARTVDRADLVGYAYLTLMDLDQKKTAKNVEVLADSALHYLDPAVNKWEYVLVVSRLGQYYAYRDRCEEGLRQFEIADSMLVKHEMANRIERAVNGNYLVGLRACRLFERIPPLVRRMLAEATEAGEEQNRFFLYDLNMTAFAKIGPPDSARYYMDTMEAMLPELGLTQNYGSFYSNAAAAAYDLGDYEEANRLAKLGLEFAERYRPIDRYRVGKWAVISGSANQTGNYPEAAEFAERAARFYDAAGQMKAARDQYEVWGDAALRMGRIEAGRTALARARAVDDSLSLVAHRSRVDSLLLEFETERAERRLTGSELARVKAEKMASRNLVIILVLIGLMVIAALLALLWRNQRRRRELEYDRKQAELRYNLLRAQMNPHFIFNSLNSIQSFFSNQRFGQGNEFLGTFSQLVRRVLEQTGQKAITLAEEIETLDLYLQLEKLRLGNVLAYQIHLDPDLDPEIMRVPPLIFQPFVENAIWHGIAPKNGPGKIDIYLEYDETRDAIAARIEDDGLGMKNGTSEKNKGHRSRGVEITRERLGKEGHIDIRDRSNEEPGHTGVRTDLVIPLWA